MQSKTNPGFTLIEVLIALFIFAIVAIIMTNSLRYILKSQAATENKAKQMASLQLAFLIMARDFSQSVNRPIINAKGILENSLEGAPQNVVFTHGGYKNPQGKLLQSSLQRTSYTLENGNLIRSNWRVLDQTAKSQPEGRVILENIKTLRFEFLDTNRKFTNHWPTQDQAFVLPIGVRISLNFVSSGKLTQLFLLPGSYVQPSP